MEGPGLEARGRSGRRRGVRWFKAMAATAIITGTIAVASVMAPQPAAAALIDTHVTTSTNVNIRSCASTSCTVVGYAAPGHRLTTWCYRAGTVINGWLYWDVVYNRDMGVGGFITEAYLHDRSQPDACHEFEGGVIVRVDSAKGGGDNLNMRSCASTGCRLIGTTNWPEALLAVCFQWGTNINGNPHWLLVYATNSGKAGFVSEYYTTAAGDIPICG